MFRRIVVSLALLFSLFLPGGVLAQGGDVAAFNPLCWHKEDCLDARAAFLNTTRDKIPENMQNGWVKEKPCDDPEWGKCLPAGQTVTEISFGGKSRFMHIGEFIQYMYKYLIGLAAIAAVIMIMVAGFQYITSGGNTEAISSARKRIGGAMMGLFIAYLSYFILNALNPALVHFRLPQVWMVRQQSMMPEFCSAAPTGTLYALAADSKQQDKVVSVKDFTSSSSFNTIYDRSSEDSKKFFFCGKRFFMQNGGYNTCVGDYCDAGKRCFLDPYQEKKFYWCQEGNFFITITHNSVAKDLFPMWATEEWEDPAVHDMKDTKLVAVCKGDKPGSIDLTPQSYEFFSSSELSLLNSRGVSVTIPGGGKILDNNKRQIFTLVADKTMLIFRASQCEKNGGLLGYALLLLMNEANDITDEYHAIGRDGVDLGDISRAGRNGFFNLRRAQIPASFFFTKDEILNGIQLNVEAAKIKDVDSETGSEGRDNYYQQFNISRS